MLSERGGAIEFICVVKDDPMNTLTMPSQSRPTSTENIAAAGHSQGPFTRVIDDTCLIGVSIK